MAPKNANDGKRMKSKKFISKNRTTIYDKTNKIVESRMNKTFNDTPKKKKKRVDVVRKAVKNVEELANLALPDDTPLLPWGHKGWLRNKPNAERVQVPEEKLKKYSRGEGLGKNIWKSKLLEREKEIEFAVEQAARTEILLPERTGYLVTDEGETSTQFSQREIVKSVDILSATKHFELILPQFGPYRMNYTRNGRHLVIGGRKGHIASFDWITKKLACEINVMEETFDVQWLHNELMFAVAQKKWVYIYDNQGVELHCLRNLFNVLRLEFLPYHFLLACSCSTGFLAWLDVSIGKIVGIYNSGKGHLNVMTQNPYNAVICLGHSDGTVTMWSPLVKKPLAQMLCHNKSLSSIAINPTGTYMATATIDSRVKIWDVRNLNGPLQDYRMHNVVSHMSFSDLSALAVSRNNLVEVFRDCCKTTASRAYLRYNARCSVADLQFCPYEDVLGIGTNSGFCSMIVPGAGEPNFDAYESNPFQTKKQRQEAEVKSLLEKIQPEFISLDPHAIGDVDVPTLQEKYEAKKKLMLGKAPTIDFAPRKKGRHKGTVKAMKTKKLVIEQGKREVVKAIKEIKEQELQEQVQKEEDKPYSALNRFIQKKKK